MKHIPCSNHGLHAPFEHRFDIIYSIHIPGPRVANQNKQVGASLQFWPKLGQHVSCAGADESERFILTDITVII